MIPSDRVSEIFKDCFYKKDEVIDGKPVPEPIIIEGIVGAFGLHPERVKSYTEEIESFLAELPDKFTEGWSFLNLCMTKNEELWTGLHQVCEQLMVLGMAIGKVQYCCPRDMWDILPSKMPYIQIIK